jgi:putative ABC transport system permease protein
MIRQWKAHPLGITLLSLGYMVGILVVSLGMSIISEARSNAVDSVSGNPNHSRVIDIRSTNNTFISYDQLFSVLSKVVNDVEIQMLNLQETRIEGVPFKPAVVPDMYSKQPEWQVPLLEGRNFTPSESMSKKHLVIIGKGLARSLFPKGISKNSTLRMYNEEYKVIGIIGRKERQTQWDNTIYIPFQTLLKDLNIPKDNISLVIKNNGSSPTNTIQFMTKYIKKMNPNLFINISTPDVSEKGQGQIWNSIIGTIFISGVILFVAIVNVMNLSLFWILDRRKEIAIRKALGATDKSILLLVSAEMISIAIFSAVIAIMIQYLIVPLLGEIGASIQVSWFNWIISIIIAVICGSISTITPVRATLKMDPVEALRIN